MSAEAVSVSIRGREFRVRGTQDEDRLRRVAAFLEETLSEVEARTGTVDSADLALLAALNLAREVVEMREDGAGSADPERLRDLIEIAESALGAQSA